MAKKHKHNKVKLPLWEKISVVVFFLFILGAAIGFGFWISKGGR